jgi:steroid 5-alpha reductase family enzyme
MFQEIIIIAGVLFLCFIALFVLSMKLQDNSIADVFWGVWFVLIAILSYILGGVWYTSQVVMTLLVCAWGIRLFLNILSKKLPYSGKEDARYKRWRESWTYFYTRSFFQVYVFQGLLMLLVATPIFVLNLSSWFEENITLTFLGASIALFGLLYEARGDAELAGFIKNKKSGDILTGGLRYFSRYPQYFWESVFWFGIAMIAAQVGLWGFVGWIIITLLVRYVSGVPLLEERYKWQENYEKYSETTPIFFPDFSKIRFKK